MYEAIMVPKINDYRASEYQSTQAKKKART